MHSECRRTRTYNKAPPPTRSGDTWNSHFRSEGFCYSENTLFNLPVHRADDDGRLVTIIFFLKNSKMPTEINS